MWFNINWSRFGMLLLPTFMRNGHMNAWITLLLSPVADVHYWWLQYRRENIYNLAHNSQICYLRAALNDRFDNQQRRIRIDEGNAFKRKYIYTDAEEKPTFLGTMYLYDDSDYADTGVDFIVVVPADLLFSIYEMKSLVDFYRLASKRYKIIKE